MNDILMIYPRQSLTNRNNATEWFRQEAFGLGMDLGFECMEDLMVKISPLKVCPHLPRIALMRGYNEPLSLTLELLGVQVVNTTASMHLAQNKMLTHIVLDNAQLPTPRTIFSTDSHLTYQKVAQTLKASTFVAKGLYGSKGEQIWLLKNETDFISLHATFSGELLYQEYISYSKGHDIRVWVVGGEAVDCVERCSDTDFRSNYALGGKAERHVLTPAIKKLAEDATRSIGLEFAGVDLLKVDNEEKYTICEVNGNAGFRTLSMVGGENLPRKILEYINKKN